VSGAAEVDPGDDVDALVPTAQDGDRRALEALIAALRPMVLQYCRARIGAHDGPAAEDLAQEVCLAVATALPTYRPQGKPFRAFVYGIAAHKLADQRRSAGRRPCTPVSVVPDAPVPSDGGPEQRALAQERTRRLRAMLDALPPGQRDVLVLRAGMGYSAEETAQLLGSRPGAVRVAQHRGMVRLRAQAQRLRDL
jgi:RNA polymerase sigma-70 factor (ECF subfamily)